VHYLKFYIDEHNEYKDRKISICLNNIDNNPVFSDLRGIAVTYIFTFLVRVAFIYFETVK
jgi:hypothetical protein